jgi:hypothetical protein
MADDARRRILERRAAFIAAAIASLATTSCEETQPKVCLSALPDEKAKSVPTGTVDASSADPDAELGPAPCLSEVPYPKATADAGARDARPRPCLKMALPRDAGPMVCLEIDE